MKSGLWGLMESGLCYCIILKNAVGDEHPVYSMHCVVSVGANLFAHNLLFVRMNSHLHPPQLRFFRFILLVAAFLIILKTAVATPLMLRYTLLRKALSTNGVVSIGWVAVRPE